MNKHFFQVAPFLLIVLMFAIVLQSCSAGGGETGTGQAPDTSVSVGVITGFGSVYVNGVKYETSSSTAVSVDGNTQALESHLAVGMLVTVSGNVNSDGVSGAASSITFEDNVEGPVLLNLDGTDLVVSNNTLNVMGQNVIFDKETVFQANSQFPLITLIEEIQLNHVVEVSGYSNGKGDIFATRIELKRGDYVAGEDIEIKGIVSNLNSSSFTFSIGNMTINYEGTIWEDFESPIQNDDFVAVKSQQAPAGNILVASSIEHKEKTRTSVSTQLDKEIEFEGVVSFIDAANSTFKLNTETVLVDGSTVFDDNRFFSDLKDKSKVKIHAHLNEASVIVADKIEIKQKTDTYFEGKVKAINLTDRSIQILDQTIFLNNSTRLKDDSSSGEELEYDRQYFQLSDLKVEDSIQVSAYLDSTGALVATRLERENEKTESDVSGIVGIKRELEGLVSEYSLDQAYIVVSGVRINIETAVSTGQVNGILAPLVNVEVHAQETTDGWYATEIDVKTEDIDD